MDFEVRSAIIIIAFILFIISHLAGSEGHKRAKRFDWEAYTFDVKRQKNVQRPANKFTTAKIIAEAKNAKNYVVGVDTNILIEDHRTLDKLVDEQIAIVLSNKVRQELDGLKKHQDEQVRDHARYALKSIYELELENKLKIIEVTQQQANEYGLNISDPDEYIVASYLNHNKPVIFFTNDNNARLTAKQRNLHVQELIHISSDGEDPFKIKPGNGLKWISLLTYCFAVGLTAVAATTIGEANDNPVNAITAKNFDETFHESKLNLDSEGRFIIKNEFNTAYLGDYNEEWGGVALYDVKSETLKGHMNRVYQDYSFDFAYFIKDDKFKDLEDVLKIKLSNETENTLFQPRITEISNETKLNYSSLGAKVKMFGVNASGYYKYQDPSKDGKGFDLDNTSIIFYHSVTGEEIFKIQATVNSKQLEEDK